MQAESAHTDVVREPASPVGELKRGIGPGMLLLFVLGDILGAGIYARVGAVAGEVGGAIWVSFLVALVVSSLTALSYAELASKYPGAGGAALFVHNAFRNKFFTFMVAFGVLASGIASASAVSRAFGGRYLAEFIALPSLPVALVFLIVIALINFRGISESVKVNMTLTVIELSGLLLIVLIGIVTLAGGTGDPGRAFTFKPGENVALAILAGAVVAFYAFLGFEDAVNVAEETQDPVRMMPRGLLGGLALASLVYLAVSFTAAMVVDTETLSKSSGPLLEVVNAGPIAVPGGLFSIIALLAISNTALINMIMGSRLLYGMAVQGVVPRVLAKTHSSRKTPWVAIIFTTLLALVLVTTGDLGPLADTTVLLLLAVFTLVNVAVLILRRDPADHPHFKAPTFVPVLGALTCLALLTQQNPDIWLRAAGLLAVGVVLWVVNYFVTRRLDETTAPTGVPAEH
jgi:APA family basic amino acid/polyamine antiporter